MSVNRELLKDHDALEKMIVERFLGIPYACKGRDPKTGLDCWGLALCVYEMLGVKLFDLDVDYDVKWHEKGGNYLAENLWRDWEPVQKPEFLGTVLFSSMEGVAYHGGICLRDGKFIHGTKKGVIVSRFSEPMLLSKVEGYYRLKKLYE